MQDWVHQVSVAGAANDRQEIVDDGVAVFVLVDEHKQKLEGQKEGVWVQAVWHHASLVTAFTALQVTFAKR